MRRWLFLIGCGLATIGLRADQAADLVQIHVEVIGGKERIEALKSLRADGVVLTGGKKVKFTLIAARPNRLRLETGAEGRSLVQASDGVAPPWKYDTGTVPPKYQAMGDADGRVFVNDAEFDDPLVAGAARGYGFDYAGELEAGGKKLLRLLVTRNLTETFSVLLDAETYFLVAKIERRDSPGGRKVDIVTRYEDFRPINGVLLPHRLALVVDGSVKQLTMIENVEPNPPVTAATFARPLVPQAGKR